MPGTGDGSGHPKRMPPQRSPSVKELIQQLEQRSPSRLNSISSTHNTPPPITARFRHRNPAPATIHSNQTEGGNNRDAGTLGADPVALATPSKLSPMYAPVLGGRDAPPSPTDLEPTPSLSIARRLSFNSQAPTTRSETNTLISDPFVVQTSIRGGYAESGMHEEEENSAGTKPWKRSGESFGHSSSYVQLQDLQADSSSSSTTKLRRTTSSSTLVASMPEITQRHRHRPSSKPPVETTELFSHRAAALSLPELDRYMEGLPSTQFSHPIQTPPSVSSIISRISQHDPPIEDHRQNKPPPKRFPPLDLLDGASISNLRDNSGLPPTWRDRNTLFSVVTGWVLGLTGSSMIATFYSLQGVYDSIQVFALILTSIVHMTSDTTKTAWRQLLLGVIPNVLALNISALTQSVVVFVVFQLCTFGLVIYFHWQTRVYIHIQPMHEGIFQLPESAKSRGWGLLLVSFLLMVLYLPVSTLTVHALVWTSDFWPVANPYLNATTFPPVVPPLGPSTEFRDPLDFCYTTTMRQDSFNWAPFVIICSLLSFASVTVYVPIRLWLTTTRCLPVVERFSALGRPRNEIEMEHEYQRLLDRDPNPVSFLYNDFRRTWGTYKSIYLVMKLVALLTVAVIDPNNCLFRNNSRTTIAAIRQSVLLAEMIIALIMQSVLVPFVDPISNASEWTSRAGYVVTSLLGLISVLKPSTATLLTGPVLYIVYIVNYGLNLYFALIHTSWVRRFMHKVTRRLYFSIDIFSPQLDISSSSVHTLQRIHQESVSAILLADPTCRMPTSERMIYVEGPKSEWPPYLTRFSGSPAERHSENLKILSDVGSEAYDRAADLYYGAERRAFKDVQRIIQKEIVGPDAYWYEGEDKPTSCARYFGNAWWVPFPPTLVMRYDSGSVITLSSLDQLEAFIAQNLDQSILEKRQLRLALRALDGQRVHWPYTHTQLVGARAWNPFNHRRYKIQSTTNYQDCHFFVKRNGVALWQGVELGSGFLVQLNYARDVDLGPTIIGLDDDLNMTPQLSHFLLLNQSLISERLPGLLAVLDSYRLRARKDAQWKAETLSYRFLVSVYASSRPPSVIAKVIEDTEKDIRVRDLPLSWEDAFLATYERMQVVSRSQVATWWYIFWDDLWRQNHLAISSLQTHQADFDPHYPSSIAYRPLPRPALESFLTQRGVLQTNGKGKRDFVHVGLINKMYVRLSQIAFSGKSRLLRTHVGRHSTEIDITEINLGSHARSSTLGTGAGTDYDDSEIRARPAFRWEGIYAGQTPEVGAKRAWPNPFPVWFGINPREGAMFRGQEVGFDVVLKSGRYVAVGDMDST
ncbi:hypothetical protein FRB95_005315 [Tulasnella sp. JGI-2019a]|nr:hypothetical protein FRB95_005315 [Tulasnella sp. JGI-2019a]